MPGSIAYIGQLILFGFVLSRCEESPLLERVALLVSLTLNLLLIEMDQTFFFGMRRVD